MTEISPGLLGFHIFFSIVSSTGDYPESYRQCKEEFLCQSNSLKWILIRTIVDFEFSSYSACEHEY